MRILFDIGHPAQVHNFKYTYWELEKRGNKVKFIAKDKEITKYLLEKYHLNHIILSNTPKGFLKKIILLPFDFVKYSKIIIAFKPDIVLSRFSIVSCIILWLFRIPHIALSDTENAFNLSFFPNAILTSYSFTKNFGTKHIKYSGNIELFYLHPNRFKPNSSILNLLGVKKDEKYVIIRFVSWDAHHDVGESGLSLPMKIQVVKELSKHAKVFISSEGNLPDDLKQYQIKIPPERMHDALYYASLFFGESPTMTSEAALLGTPAVLISSWACECGNIINLKNYELIKCFTPELEEDAYKNAINLIKAENTKEKWNKKRDKFLSDNIDVTQFVVWFIENYPKSIQELKNNKQIESKFKINRKVYYEKNN